MLVDCTYCGGTIIAPADIAEDKELKHKRKLKTGNSIVGSLLSGLGAEWKDGSYVIDLRSSSKRAQQNLGSAVAEIRHGQESNAVNVFTQTFGVESNDAKKIVNAIGHGKGFDASALRIYPEAPVSRKSEFGWLVKLIVVGVILIFVVPVVVSVLLIILALLTG